MNHKIRPTFSAFEKTHVVNLYKIALAIVQSIVCTILTYHINDVTQDVTEKYWMKKAHSSSSYYKLLKPINFIFLKSDILPERLYYSKSGVSKKLMVSVGVSWNRKTNIFFINLQKIKVDQNF